MKFKILLIDENLKNFYSLQNFLEDALYTASYCNNVVCAYRSIVVCRQKIDIIILNATRAMKFYPLFLEEIRKKGINIPIIMISSRSCAKVNGANYVTLRFFNLKKIKKHIDYIVNN